MFLQDFLVFVPTKFNLRLLVLTSSRNIYSCYIFSHLIAFDWFCSSSLFC